MMDGDNSEWMFLILSESRSASIDTVAEEPEIRPNRLSFVFWVLAGSDLLSNDIPLL
jgi:hypothetical protein